VSLPIEAIQPNPRNPRSRFSEQAINELAHSLREDGQLQPVLVRRVSPSPSLADQREYELIAGERRWRAARRAGLPAIQAAIWDVSDDESLRLALIENWHREGLSAAEQIAGLEALAEAAGHLGARELARHLRVAPSTISERLRVRRDPVVWPAVEAGDVPIGHAFHLRRAPAVARPHLLRRLLTERPTREVLDEWIDEARGEYRRSRAAVGLSVARMERASVRLSNTSLQAQLAEQYLDSLQGNRTRRTSAG
jgi:ParB family chromosome partitioning protein